MPEDPTPTHSQGFGAAEDADATRQAQHQVANDAPVDVNYNAALARGQALTVLLAGDEFQGAAARRTAVFDAIMAKIGLKAGE